LINRLSKDSSLIRWRSTKGLDPEQKKKRKKRRPLPIKERTQTKEFADAEG